jgi:predicted DNA-binding ribbon-helix-helix protein
MIKLTSIGKKRVKRAEKTGIRCTIRLCERHRKILENRAKDQQITLAEAVRRIIDKELNR